MRTIVFGAIVLCLATGCVRSTFGDPRFVDGIEGRQMDGEAVESADAGHNGGTEEWGVRREAFAEGIHRVTYRDSSLGAGSVNLYGFDLSIFQFGLAATSARLGIFEWARALPDAIAVINGGYFMEDGTPSGFFSVEGERIGRSVFDPEKSAIVNFDNGIVRIVFSTGADFSEYRTALQSYPMLIADGVASVAEDSKKTARRSFIGTDEEGTVWIGVLADTEISLYALSRLLPRFGIKWRNVINLDGGSSTGLLVRQKNDAILHETFGGVPNVIVIRKR